LEGVWLDTAIDAHGTYGFSIANHETLYMITNGELSGLEDDNSKYFYKYKVLNESPISFELSVINKPTGEKINSLLVEFESIDTISNHTSILSENDSVPWTLNLTKVHFVHDQKEIEEINNLLISKRAKYSVLYPNFKPLKGDFLEFEAIGEDSNSKILLDKSGRFGYVQISNGNQSALIVGCWQLEEELVIIEIEPMALPHLDSLSHTTPFRDLEIQFRVDIDTIQIGSIEFIKKKNEN
jgi:hypothetical protein